MSYDEIQAALDKARQAQADSERQAELEQRFGQMIDERLERFADVVVERMEASGRAVPEGGERGSETPEPEPEPQPEPEPGPQLAVERVTRMDVPRMHSGDDEPTSVRYIDADTGEEKTRKGRRKGQPYGYNVEDVTDETEEPAA